MGSLYMQNGQYDKARAEFAEVLKTDPKNIKALWSLGVVDNMTGDPQARSGCADSRIEPGHTGR